MKKVELLAPAGDYNRALTAFNYGADAVYLAGKDFSLRARAVNFTTAEMRKIVNLAHRQGKKVYVTVNILSVIQKSTPPTQARWAKPE